MICLRNVRVNNLKNIDLDIRHGELLAFCGLSGSGKSSLAFDTLYAEGQRRYLESMSPQTRQFVHQLDRPAADRIDGIPPAIAVRAYRGAVGKKTTVGSATEISEYLNLLFAKVGNVVCPVCQVNVSRNDPQSVAQVVADIEAGRRIQVAFRINIDEDWAESLLAAKRNGFIRAIVGGETIDLSRPGTNQITMPNEESIGPVHIIVDRLKSGAFENTRVRESIEIAFQFGLGGCEILIESENVPESGINVDGNVWERLSFSRELKCQTCQRRFPPPEPRRFSASNKLGACQGCDGVGWTGKEPPVPCEKCNGSRLNENALSVYVGGKNLAEIGSLKIGDVAEFFCRIDFSESKSEITRQILPQIQARLKYLSAVGLDYLTLDRRLRTLSAGEAQRVALTSCLSSALVNLLYVLDEPSIGLHSHDLENLAMAIKGLHRRGNTVVVVDHDECLLRSMERIVEIGPAAGASGGEVVFDGSLDDILISETSITGDFLAGRRGVSWGGENRRTPRGRIKLTGARGHNLKNIDVEFPLGCLCVVTGVSGAGKSSLVQQTLHGAIAGRKGMKCPTPLAFDEVFGDSQFDDVVLVDQTPIGRSPRSNPVTYVKAFDDIRRTYAETVDARTHNIPVGKFSFNVAGGRCDKCNGDGQLRIDMQFMPDIYVVCDQCRGTRYRDEVLAVKYRGKSISETLNLTVREAFSFFRGQPKVQAKLKSLIDVGLEYIRLGQPATTLSSGEAQRLKLGHYLNASKTKRALFILDEPTTGLHMSDVTRLLDCFEMLVAVGHSLIVVEHNLQVVGNADWVIDLGPGAADSGGQVVVAGSPETVAACSQSVTGHYLKTGFERFFD